MAGRPKSNEAKKVFDITKPSQQPGRMIPKPKPIDAIQPKQDVQLVEAQSIAPGDTPVIVKREGVRMQPINDIVAPSDAKNTSVTVNAYKRPPTLEELSQKNVVAAAPTLEERAKILEPPKQIPEVAETSAELMPLTPQQAPSSSENASNDQAETAKVPTPSIDILAAVQSSATTAEDAERAPATETTSHAETTEPSTDTVDVETGSVPIDDEEPTLAPEPGDPDTSKLNKIKSDHAAVTEGMQLPSVYDTKEYFLPISKHHGAYGAARTVLAIFMIALLLLAGFVAAIDAGLVSTDFVLPFDIIPNVN